MIPVYCIIICTLVVLIIICALPAVVVIGNAHPKSVEIMKSPTPYGFSSPLDNFDPSHIHPASLV
ncbi:MAG: hypothetical protein Terrestrivirus9_36 [Terrestrivirus sp.]|uniref:Uncharacterized protein n=1 Tax=Terrestrivirus sp. TaxID=2487775 RepID=A0A3G4ZT34_9VIRU|nr:MAG: hypothetical protein Terrestrivirus9_36 [Terrestrivirus sp.]